MIKRYPAPRTKYESALQAWDSADELILSHLSEMDLKDKRIVIVGDQFGAIACGLSAQGVGNLTSYTDSYLGAKGLELNSEGKLRAISTFAELKGPYDVAVLRVPKNLSYFEDCLAHLTGHLKPGAQIVCGYMVKYQAGTAFDLLNRIIGTTTTSLAKKKARLIFAKFEKSKVVSPYPVEVIMDGFPLKFTNHSNLFSREKLDIGTRFFLEHIPTGPYKTILDLGCANGVIGIAAKQANPNARVIFTDESKMAVESAQTNYAKYFRNATGADFYWTNLHEGGAPDSVDLILCNPPFHQGGTTGDFIARQMFHEARRLLKVGGVIRVIGNSHLKYQVTLKQILGESEVVATTNKFMIADATKLAELPKPAPKTSDEE